MPITAVVDVLSGKAYVGNFWSNYVSVINRTTLGLVATVATGVQPMASAVDRSSRKVYVSCAPFRLIR